MKMPLLAITCPYADCAMEFEVPVALRPKGRTESGDMELSVTADTSEFRMHVNSVHNIVSTWATDEIIEMGLE